MKKLVVPAIILLAFLFTGCENEADIMENEPVPEKEFSATTFDFNTKTIFKGKPDVLAGQVDKLVQTKSNSSKVTGHFHTSNGSSFDFSAIKNKGGTHGEFEMELRLGAVKGKIIDQCISENVGSIVVIITEILSPGVFEIDDLVYYSVKDGGEGKKADPDQFDLWITRLYNWHLDFDSPQDVLVEYPCGSYLSGVWRDVASGQIQVD